MAFFINGNATFDTTSGTKTLAAIPVTIGDLIVLIVANTGSTATPTVSDDNPDGKGAYTQIVTGTKVAATDTGSMWIRNDLIGNATNTTVTMAPGATTGGGLRSWRIGGMSRVGPTAIRQSAVQSNGTAATTPAPAFSVATLPGNMIVGAIFNGTNPAGMTPPSGFTEHGDTGYATPAAGLEACDVNSGQTLTTVTWGSTSASAFEALILELDASAQQIISPDLPLIQSVNHLSPI